MQKLRTVFPEFIYEALITKVDYKLGVCTLSILSPNLEDVVENVPLPNHLGTSNSGIFHGLDVGTRVIAANTSGNGREFSVILGTLPKDSLISSNFNNLAKPQNTPIKTIPYPDIASGRMIIRGGAGNSLNLMENGEIELSTVSKKGIFLKKDRLKVSQYNVSENNFHFNNSGRSVFGEVQRSSIVQKNLFVKKGEDQAPLDSDLDYHFRSQEIGFFSGSKTQKRSYGGKKRNLGLSEHRSVFREFSTDYHFFGFDRELIKSSSLTNVFNSEINSRYKEIGNSLDLAPGELIEVIHGNVVTIDGKIMDINYNLLNYGESNNSIPAINKENIEKARRVSRRGIGYHFQLSTRSNLSEKNTSKTNLIFDVDKEGAFKINIPKTSSTGNILYSSFADFSEFTPTISYHQNSNLEPIPVMLRDSNGEIVLPNKNSQGLETRSTGIRFSNSDDNPYFPTNDSNSNYVRVNLTKYHNMYAVAERLIANSIDLINIPVAFVDDNGLSTGFAANKPFEILYPEEYYREDEEQQLLDQTSEVFPLYMSTAVISPGSPAIYTGGDTLVNGIFYNKKNIPCSNSFKLKNNGSELFAESVDDFGNLLRSAGGVSGNINLEGSLITSIGSDDIDKKSLLLDTNGSIISWIGKDLNNRSIVTQTDGHVLINIGGSYEGTGPDSENKVMNVGRFDLRVNVTDKGFVSSTFNDDTGDDNSNPLWQSDIVISLSEKGIVIAGMKTGIPMVIRNQDKILIESVGSDVVLKGTDVKFTDVSGRTKTLKSEGR